MMTATYPRLDLKGGSSAAAFLIDSTPNTQVSTVGTDNLVIVGTDGTVNPVVIKTDGANVVLNWPLPH
jgi:hypothetical protein